MSDIPDLIRLNSLNGDLTAFIAPDMGAELCGLEWRGRELLWRGRDFSPTTGWTGRAPVLWPAIGRTFAPGSQPTEATFKQAPLGWMVNGVLYDMPMHGFARSLPWQVETGADHRLSLKLQDSDETRRSFPFGFIHRLDYRLDDGGLILTHQIEASADNRGPMPFVLGNHATFIVPADVDGRPMGAVQTNTNRRKLLGATGRPTGEIAPFEAFSEPTPVADIERWEVIALATADKSPRAVLTLPGGLSVAVSHRASDPSWSELEFVTFWGDPVAGYLSIEAWLGQPNALASGDGLVVLAPGSSVEWTMRIDVSPCEVE